MSSLKISRSLVLVACLLLLAGLASAGSIVDVTVIPSIGPDPFSSTSYGVYSMNAVYALQHNLSIYGETGPGQYTTTHILNGSQVIGTDFPSWLGQAPPPAGYEDETGNMLYYGLIIRSMGSLFSLNDVFFQDMFYGTTGPVRSLADVGYGFRLTGINYGSDNAPGGSGTAKDIVYDFSHPGGTGSSLVNVVYFSGFGVQFYVSDPADLASSQGLVNLGSEPYSSGTYTVNTAGGTFSGEALVTPEPGTMLLGGFGLALLLIRKRLN